MSGGAMARLTMLKPRVAVLDTRRVKPPPKVADSIYSTPEYAIWRAAVIRRAGGRCEDPKCPGPHWPGQRVYADHVKELRDGGAPFDVNNGMCRCARSHGLKTAAERARRAGGRGDQLSTT